MFIVEDQKKIQKNQADIRIVGVGGGGNNAIETMIKEGIKGVNFIAINTDNQALSASSAPVKIQIGSKLTRGLGAGANPEVGRRAAVESYEDIVNSLKGADMVFITAGMGGGTGTGGAPFVAQAANELGILTVAIVTKPFLFEGNKRLNQAVQGISELSQHVDTLIVIPNEKLLKLSQKETPLLETFAFTDDILLQAVKGIAELVSVPGFINLDFADIQTVMKDKGMALMGRGLAEGSDRAEKAIESAISSPLLDEISIKGATGMIVNITSDHSLSLLEVQSATSVLTKLTDPSADVIVGTVIDDNMAGKLSVTVIATGFDNKEQKDYLGIDRDSKESAYLDQPSTENISEANSQKPAEIIDKEIQMESEIENSINEYQAKELELVNEASLTPDQPLEKDINEADHESSADTINQTEPVNTSIENSLDEEPAQESKKADEKPSVRDMLLSKAREYQEQKVKTKAKSSDSEEQVDMNLSKEKEQLFSPLEESIDFSDEDLNI